eukprot:1194440-Prorocentrum_lima.AAC.1
MHDNAARAKTPLGVGTGYSCGARLGRIQGTHSDASCEVAQSNMKQNASAKAAKVPSNTLSQ